MFTSWCIHGTLMDNAWTLEQGYLLLAQTMYVLYRVAIHQRLLVKFSYDLQEILNSWVFSGSLLVALTSGCHNNMLSDIYTLLTLF